LAISCFVIVKIINKPYSFILGVVLILISAWFSYTELDKRLGLKTMFANFRNKYLDK
jgi:hypothetical protein